MMPIRQIIGVLSALAVLTLASSARAASADDIVGLLDYGGYYDSISVAAISHIVSSLEQDDKIDASEGERLSVELQADVVAYRPVFMGQIASYFAANFNAGELDAIRDFYATDAGHRLNQLQKGLRDQIAASSEQFGLALGAAAAQHIHEDQ